MIKEDKQAGSTGCAPYAGSGTLSDYKKDGSWMMNQIEKGYDKVQRGITVDKSGDSIRYAKRQNKIASKVINASEDFKIVKTYKQLSSVSRNDYRFALRWCLCGELDGSSLQDLNLIQQLLNSKVNNDACKLSPTFKIQFEYCSPACLDFKKNCIKIEAIVSFEVSIVTDNKQIIEFLGKLGFDTIKQD